MSAGRNGVISDSFSSAGHESSAENGAGAGAGGRRSEGRRSGSQRASSSEGRRSGSQQASKPASQQASKPEGSDGVGYQDGAGGLVRHRVRHAAKDAAGAGHALVADDDEVGVHVAGYLADGVGGGAGYGVRVNLDPGHGCP